MPSDKIENINENWQMCSFFSSNVNNESQVLQQLKYMYN